MGKFCWIAMGSVALLAAVACKAELKVETGKSGPVAAKRAPPATKAAASIKDIDAEAKKKAEEKKVVKEYKYIKLEDKEIELNTGIMVNFRTGAATFGGDTDYDILNEVASALSDNPELKIRVEGHTDATGAADQNMQLSADRAYAVYDYLKVWGVPEERLDWYPCGQDYPIADNATASGQAANRRVEFVIMKGDPQPCVSLLPE